MAKYVHASAYRVRDNNKIPVAIEIEIDREGGYSVNYLSLKVATRLHEELGKAIEAAEADVAYAKAAKAAKAKGESK